MAVLKEGAKAPDFKVADEKGKIHQLKDYKGKTVILYFYPRDLTPGCTTEACEFQENLATIKRKKTVVLGVSRDTPEKHQKFIDKYDLKFPLLADVDGKLCEAYGVWQKKKFMGKEFMGIVRTTFVIDPQGKISKVYEKVKVKNHVETVIAEL